MAAAVLALPAVGSAARPKAVQQGYAQVGGVAASVHRPAAAQVAAGSTLPFTGLDLGLAAAGGGALLLLGGALKKTAGRE